MNFIFVGIGGFFGAISRYGVYLLSSRVLSAGFLELLPAWIAALHKKHSARKDG
ncbi:MAG: hypothetical protein LBH05_00575 [Deferribacteraceae bacterium]|jgi:fluoride ion exporter CrcB/FEX|nr:hypothetical protein [Deferribacteraceae bacterium]